MKTHSRYLLPAALSLAAVAAFADEPPRFSEADKDRNGVLSMEEAKAALPELNLEDANGDGVLNRAEVKQSIANLQLPDAGSPAKQAETPVGVADYRLIVQAIVEDDDGGIFDL